ncbi:MAG: helix-turn-helix transcriptional regulator [Nitrospirota bacterium]
MGEYLDQLHHAIVDLRLAEITYRAVYNNEATCRLVEPYYLLFKENMWYLRGYCRLRKEMRTFALDKIESLDVQEKHYVKNRQVLPTDELAGAFHVVLDGEPVDVVLRFDAKVKQYILRQKWVPSQTEKELPDGRLEVKVRVNGFAGLKPWIYRWIPHVEVVGPKELRTLVQDEMLASVKRNE